MTFRNLIFIYFLFLGSLIFSQTSYNNIDTLLFKVFETVNLKDSSKYISVINTKGVFTEKKIYSKQDSLIRYQPFYESYSDFVSSIAEMAGSENFTIRYLEFSNPSQKNTETSFSGKILLHVKLLVNDSFVITCPFTLTCHNGTYTSENNLMTMFLEN